MIFIRLSKVFVIILALILISSTPCFSGTKIVGETTGSRWNPFMKKWVVDPVVVYIDEGNYVYIMAGSIGPAKAYFSIPKERDQIIYFLEKGLEWSKKAKEKQIELKKELGSVTRVVDSYFDRRAGIELTFFSANKAKQTNIIITIHDFEYGIIKSTVYLNNQQVRNLIKLLKKAPEVQKKFKESEKEFK